MDLSKIQAVLFDLDGTLYHQVPLRGFMALELATTPMVYWSFRRAISIIRMMKKFRSMREELRDLGCPVEQSLLELQYSRPAEAVGVSSMEVEGAVREWMYRRPLKYLALCRRKGVIDFFEKARHRGLRLGVFSDYPVQEKLEALGLLPNVDLMLCATDPEVNAFKPHSRGFLRACEILKLAPHEILYVGDRVDVDAKGAAAAGMPCVIFHGKQVTHVEALDQPVFFPSFSLLQQFLLGGEAQIPSYS